MIYHWMYQQNCKLRIHSKPDENQSKLTVGLGLAWVDTKIGGTLRRRLF